MPRSELRALESRRCIQRCIEGESTVCVRSMQYGRSGGHPGGHRLVAPGLAPRASERESRPGAFPDILWRASGVTTRPGSGLRVTVRHMDVPQHLSEPQGIPPLAQHTRHHSRSEPTGRPLHYQPPRNQRRSSLRDTPRLLPRQTAHSFPTEPPAAFPATSSTAHPKATRTMLPPLPVSPPRCEEPAEEEEKSSNESQGESSSLEDSEEEVAEQNKNTHQELSCKLV